MATIISISLAICLLIISTFIIQPTIANSPPSIRQNEIFCIQDTSTGHYLHHNGVSIETHHGLSISPRTEESCFQNSTFVFRHVSDNDGLIWIQNVNLGLPVLNLGIFYEETFQIFFLIGAVGGIPDEIRTISQENEGTNGGRLMRSVRGNYSSTVGATLGPIPVLSSTNFVDQATVWRFQYQDDNGTSTTSIRTTTDNGGHNIMGSFGSILFALCLCLLD